jgi:hypothetical protein
MVLDRLLPSVHLQSFFEWTHTSFEQSVAEFYTILLEHLQVALEMLRDGNLFFSVVSKTDQSASVMSKSADYVGLQRC